MGILRQWDLAQAEGRTSYNVDGSQFNSRQEPIGIPVFAWWGKEVNSQVLDLWLSEEIMSAAENSSEDKFSAAKRQITEWLMAEDWKIQENPGGSESAWVIVAEDHQKKKVAFGQFNKKPDFVFLQANLTIHPDLSLQISNLDPAKRDKILWEIRFQLLNMGGLKFSGVNPKLGNIRMNTRLYLEGLTRNEFARTVGTIQDSVLAILWIIRKHLGQPEPPEQPPELVM